MLWVKIKTVFALGIDKLLRVLWYRFSVKYNINPVRRIQVDLVAGDCFKPTDLPIINAQANRQWIEQQTYFGWYVIADTQPPHWHKNCMTGVEIENPLRPWWQIPDFNPRVGDIKTVWEASRFDWCVGFAQQVRLGDAEYIGKLNAWISDWRQHNPPYLGVNWKCGQEASIRVMHLAMAAIILGQTEGTSLALVSLIKAHLQRIYPTVSYAISQDNNHGTSEAAALFIGGNWLLNSGDADGKKWQFIGRKLLENRAKRLIKSDGSFSQYSTNYHRVMLDTYSMVEVWRVKHQLPAFSQLLYQRLQVATDWLRLMVQDNGDVPNLGANDGARLLPLTDTDYRDFRPSVQLASILFYQQLAFSANGSYDLPAKWLGIERPDSMRDMAMTQTLAQGGYQIVRKDNIFALLNAPKFNFRPSQADVLHTDVWIDGKNILMDSGTYSYADVDAISYYTDVTAHNTLQFDNQPQMPRLSRFLLGNWIKASLGLVKKDDGSIFASASYTKESITHQRDLEVDENTLKIIDKVKSTQSVKLFWHLHPDYHWHLSEDRQSVMCLGYCLNIQSDVDVKLQLNVAKYSTYYQWESNHCVLMVEFAQGVNVITSVLMKL